MGQPKTIFLTGGNGFIGRNIIEQLGGTYTIYAPSRSELDLLDSNAVYTYLQKYPVDIVIHAANIGGKRNSTDTGDWEEKNMAMFQHIIAAKEFFSRMIMLGSGAEYDKSKAISLVSEEDFGTSVPKDGYGKCKWDISNFAEQVDYITHLRLFAMFGPYEDYRVRCISNNICRAIYNIPLRVNQNVYFDYTYIDDLVRIIDWFLQQETVLYKHYNICSNRQVDLVSLAQLIQKFSKNEVEIQVAKPGFGNEYTGNNDRLLAELGDFQFTPIEEAIRLLYTWYEQRKPTIDKESLFFDGR